MINDKVRVSTRANQHSVAVLSAILFIVHPTKPIFELGREFDVSNPSMVFGRSPLKND